MTLYATVDEALAVMSAGAGSSATDQSIVYRNLRVVSRRIDQLFASRRPYFAPYIEQREMRVRPEQVNSAENTLALPGPLLALSAVQVGNTTLAVGTQVEAWPTVETPYPELHLISRRAWYDFCSDNYRPLMLKVTGTWGYHSDYEQAWLEVTTLGAAIATAAITTITLSDIDGTDAYGHSPWISEGSLLQIDSEWLEVVAVDTGTNIATVRRGVNGSTAATHSNGATVSVYQVEWDIRDITARQAGFKYSRRGAYEQMTISQLTTTQYPPDLLNELKGVLAGYAYR